MGKNSYKSGNIVTILCLPVVNFPIQLMGSNIADILISGPNIATLDKLTFPQQYRVKIKVGMIHNTLIPSIKRSTTMCVQVLRYYVCYLFTHKNHRVIPLSSSCIIYTYRWTHSKGCVRLFRACKQLFWILPSHPATQKTIQGENWSTTETLPPSPRATYYTGTMEQGDKKTNTPFFGQ